MDETKNLDMEQMEEISGCGKGVGKPVLVIYACELCRYITKVDITQIHKMNKTCPWCGHKLILQK